MALYLSNRDQGRTDELGHNLVLKKLVGSGYVFGQIGLQVGQTNPIAMRVFVQNLAALIADGSTIYEAFQVGADIVTVSTSHSTLNRIDAVVVYVDKSVSPTQTQSNNPNDVTKLVVVAGSAGSNPSQPSTSRIRSTIGSNNPFLVLAAISVSSGATVIRANNISLSSSNIKRVLPAGGSSGRALAKTSNSDYAVDYVNVSGDWNQGSSSSPRYIANKPGTSGTGLISSTERSKLSGVESSATRDQTASEVRNLLQALGGTSRLPAGSVQQIPEAVDDVRAFISTAVYRSTTNTNLTSSNTTAVMLTQTWNKPSGWGAYQLMVEASLTFNWLNASFDNNLQHIGAYVRDDGSNSIINSRDNFVTALQTYQVANPTVDIGGHLTIPLAYRYGSITNGSLTFKLLASRSNTSHHININNAIIKVVAYRVS